MDRNLTVDQMKYVSVYYHLFVLFIFFIVLNPIEFFNPVFVSGCDLLHKFVNFRNVSTLLRYFCLHYKQIPMLLSGTVTLHSAIYYKAGQFTNK